MGNKSIVTRKYWRGLEEQFEGNPIPASIYLTQSFKRTGSDNPKFRSTIKSGADATNPMTVTLQDVYFVPGRANIVWKGKTGPTASRYGKIIKSNFVAPNVIGTHSQRPGVLFRSSVGNSALIGIIKKIRKYETSDFSGPTFAGELRETLSMIRSPLKSLRLKTGLFTDLHMRILRDKQARGGKFKADKWSKVLSDTWLEYTFGAAPLMSDIAGIIDLFLETKNERFDKFGLKRLSFRFSDTYHDINQTGVASFNNCKFPFAEWRHFRASSQYVVWVDNRLIFLGQDPAKRVVQAAKFDLSEIIPTAWELMPWSFLVDYWTNIGDVLGSTFDFNRNVVFAKLTEEDSCILFHEYGAPYSTEPSFSQPFEFQPWAYTSLYKTLNRRSVSRLGFPQLDVNLPKLGQTFNMAALMHSLANNNPFRGHTLK